MKTKDKILVKAKELFNELGSDAVTVRRIAAALGISHGNLCYHYPTTDDIIEKLYFQLIQELDTVLLRGEKQTQLNIDLAFLYRVTRQTFEIQYEYRFLLLDFVRIMRRLPQVRTHYRSLVAFRLQTFQLIMEQLIQKDLARAEIVEGQFLYFVKQVTLFSDFWLSEAEVLFDGEEKDKISTFHALSFSMIAPYLTEKGLLQYRALIAPDVIHPLQYMMRMSKTPLHAFLL